MLRSPFVIMGWWAADIIGGIRMRQNRRRFEVLGRVVGLGLMMSAWAAWGQAAGTKWQGPCVELAKEIAGITGAGVVSLTVKNASSIASDEVVGIQSAIVRELANDGVQTRAAAEVAATVRVTLSQSAKGGVWVAEVQQGPEVRVAMVPVTLPEAAAKVGDAELVLSAKLLVTQAEPVLDAQWMSDETGRKMLAVLGSESLAVYAAGESGGGVGGRALTLPIQHERAFPRDVRGRLEVAAGAVKAHLPGVVCTLGMPSEGAMAKSLSCMESDDPWLVDSRSAFFHSGRNYFTGVAVPALSGNPQPFYTYAEVSERRGGMAVVSFASGGFGVVDGNATRPLGGTRDWGSDVAPLRTGCGSGVQVLGSSAGDGAQDSLMAYEVDGAQAVAASAPLPMAGGVVAMWAATAEPGVMVVIERDAPERFEVYRVTGACAF